MDKHLQFRGSKIHYTTIGNGNPVVLVHGFAEDSRIWNDLVTVLQAKYQLIIPYIPGSGRSAMLDQGIVTMDDYAACIKDILDAEKLTSVVMIGHSMGGYISLAFAEKYPERLRSLGLFHSSAFADDEEKKETRRKAIGFIRQNGAMAFLRTSIPGLFRDPEKSHEDIEGLLKKGVSFSEQALIQYYEAMISRPDRTGILKYTGIPFLFIMGVYDKAVPFQHSLKQSQLPVHSYVYILRESAHMGMLEETDKCRRILADFLADVYRN